MKAIAFSFLAVALIVGTVSFGASTPAGKKIAGDYVEARTASVFAGACHYNGELVTTGRDAVMAWSFTAGTFNGVDLAGAKAMAAVTSDANLSQDAAKKVELVIDSRLSEAQAKAVEGLLREKVAALGKVVAVRPAPVDPQKRPSEHDPQWQLADVEVSSLEKGNAPLRQVTFCFPGSNDELWSESPKFRPGQTGIWLLRQADRAKGRPLPAGVNLGIWAPRDYHPAGQAEAIRAQMRGLRAQKPQ